MFGRLGLGASFGRVGSHSAPGGGDPAPTITSADTASVDENEALSHALTANEAVTWSIVGGADQAQFEISGSTLRWASNGTQDYEDPQDADTNNTYVVTVRATDSGTNTTDQTITVTVNDVEDAELTFIVAGLVSGYVKDASQGRHFITPMGMFGES